VIHGQSEALGANAVEKALEGDGDSIMLRALKDTLVPTRRDRTVEFDLPKIETPNEATEIMALISTHVRRIAIVELEERIPVLERKQV
jgi:hypothetical protein